MEIFAEKWWMRERERKKIKELEREYHDYHRLGERITKL